MKINLSLLSLMFVGQVWAQSAPQTKPADPMQGLLMQAPIFLALIALFWFGILRPQRQQQKKHQQFVSSLSKGQEVVTTGGLIGKIVGLTDRVVTLEIDQGTEIKILRSQVQGEFSAASAAPANKS